MIRHLSFILIALLGFPSILSGQTNTQEEINGLIQQYLPPSSEVGIAVYNLTTDQWVYQHQGYKLSRPASTMKLVTAITALTFEAPAFETSLWYQGEIRDKVLYGDIYVVGGFDPEFGDKQMDKLASSIKALNITKVQGHLYGDISLKDSLYWGAGWGWDDNPNAYQPYLSPLMYNKGKVTIVAKPQAKGYRAKLSVQPQSSYYTLTNTTQTNTPTLGKFEVTRKWLENKNEILVMGNVDRYRMQEVNLENSADYFLHVLCEKLSKHQITISQGYGTTKNLPSQANPICKIVTPIQEVLKNLLKESDNLNGEALLVALARLDKTKSIQAEDGIHYINKMVEILGDDPENYQFADGCGLSSYNLISANLLVELLKYSYTHKNIYQQILPALPVAGIDGTLAYRMKNSPAYRKTKAKTGTINSISTLAGYTENSKGEILAFAILNQNIIKNIQARRFQDALCALLSR